MNADDAGELDRGRALMMAALDDECTPAERAELDALLAARPELNAEWTRLRRLKEVTVTMTLRTPPQEVWDRYWTSVYNRAERGIAWVLVSLGATVLAAWGLWHWFEAILRDTDAPVAIRVAMVALAVGLLMLGLSVARERWFLRSRDPYTREVKR